MKKTLVASILGMAVGMAAVSTAYGQGSVKFDTYNAPVYAPVKYTTDAGNLAIAGLAGLANTIVGNNFHAALYYGIGNTFTDFGQLTMVPGSEVTVGSLVAGYVTSGAVTVPGYVSGDVTFSVAVWAISGPSSAADFATSGVKGTSALWIEPSLATGSLPVDTFQVGVPPVIVSVSGAPIPEPTTLALTGLGALGMVLIRRKK